MNFNVRFTFYFRHPILVAEAKLYCNLHLPFRCIFFGKIVYSITCTFFSIQWFTNLFHRIFTIHHYLYINIKGNQIVLLVLYIFQKMRDFRIDYKNKINLFYLFYTQAKRDNQHLLYCIVVVLQITVAHSQKPYFVKIKSFFIWIGQIFLMTF